MAKIIVAKAVSTRKPKSMTYFASVYNMNDYAVIIFIRYNTLNDCEFSGTHENPELIWNDEAREKVCTTIRKMVKE